MPLNAKRNLPGRTLGKALSVKKNPIKIASIPKNTTVTIKETSKSSRKRAPPSNRTVRRAATGSTRKSPLRGAGKAWAKLYLNPMGKDDPSIIGYPDGSATRSVLADYRQDYNLSMPTYTSITYSSSGTPAMTAAQYQSSVGLWDNVSILFLSIPTAVNVALIRIYPSTPVTVAPTNSINSSIPTFPSWRVWGDGGAPISNTGSISFIQTLIKLDNLPAHIAASVGYRLIARGATHVYTAPALETQGFVTSAQFGTEPILLFYTKDVVATATLDNSVLTTTNTPVFNDDAYYFPLSNIAPSALVECYHNAYTSKATDGSYTPVYSSARDNPYLCPYQRKITVLPDNNTDQFNDYILPGWNTSVTWFEGVSAKFSIKYKHRSVYQYIAASGGVLANFTRQEPTDDPTALQAVWHLRNTMAHAYPSCYNDWGWLGDLVDAGLGMIPGFGTAYKFAKPLIKPAWNWIGGKVRSHFGNPVASDGDVYYDAQ
nr:capsid protein [Hepeviridae sp.]